MKIIPTWEAAAQIYVSALEHGTGAGQHAARDELLRLGRQYDEAVDVIDDLLEALQCLMSQTIEMDEKYGVALSEGEQEAALLARAAIRKAKGEDA